MAQRKHSQAVEALMRVRCNAAKFGVGIFRSWIGIRVADQNLRGNGGFRHRIATSPDFQPARLNRGNCALVRILQNQRQESYDAVLAIFRRCSPRRPIMRLVEAAFYRGQMLLQKITRACDATPFCRSLLSPSQSSALPIGFDNASMLPS